MYIFWYYCFGYILFDFIVFYCFRYNWALSPAPKIVPAELSNDAGAKILSCFFFYIIPFVCSNSHIFSKVLSVPLLPLVSHSPPPQTTRKSRNAPSPVTSLAMAAAAHSASRRLLPLRARRLQNALYHVLNPPGLWVLVRQRFVLLRCLLIRADRLEADRGGDIQE